jgi:hypothetical protein
MIHNVGYTRQVSTHLAVDTVHISNRNHFFGLAVTCSCAAGVSLGSIVSSPLITVQETA